MDEQQFYEETLKARKLAADLIEKMQNTDPVPKVSVVMLACILLSVANAKAAEMSKQDLIATIDYLWKSSWGWTASQTYQNDGHDDSHNDRFFASDDTR